MSLELIRPGTNFSFIGYRYYAFAFSGLMILVSILSIAFHGGLNLGVDFQGGLLIQARFSDPAVTPDSVWETFAASPFAVSSVQDFGQSGDTEYLINLNATGDAPDGDLSLLASAVLNERYGADKVEIRRQEMVGPKVGADLRQKALYAIFYAILIIIIYISGRFEKRWGTPLLFCAILLGVIYLVSLFAVGVGALIITALIVTVITCYFMKFSFALGGILALLHDIIITTGAFSLMGKEITLSFVAAVLTIIGYS
jgi:preprotein translocase subunit SecF